MNALTFSRFGNPDVLEYILVPIPVLNENEVLVKMKAIGLNYADIYRRRGDYHLKGSPPYIAGYEGAGIVTCSNSKKWKIGDSVAFTDVPFANAEYVSVPESHIIPIPENIGFSLAASVLLQGLTAHYLSNDSHKVHQDEIVLIYAAAGGVGQILTQICKLKGAKVIGLTRKENKIETILRNNSDHAIIMNKEWKSKIMEITNHKGVDVVYDSIGSTLLDSIEVTKQCGHIVFYGMSGGDPQHIDPRILMDSSKTLTGGDLWSYLTSEEERINRSEQLFNWILNGAIKIKKPVIYRLSEGRLAHEYLENGKSSSKIIMIPDSE